MAYKYHSERNGRFRVPSALATEVPYRATRFSRLVLSALKQAQTDSNPERSVLPGARRCQPRSLGAAMMHQDDATMPLIWGERR